MARIDEILSTLTRMTEATAKQIAHELQLTNTRVSQLLGQLYWLGSVTRKRCPVAPTIEYVYRIKVAAPAVIEAPPVVPFPARIAGRAIERV